MSEPKKITKRRIALYVLCHVAFVTTTGAMTLIALDAIGPYPILTPLAHFFLKVITPLIPLVAPFFLGLFIKVCRHETWPSKKLWVVVSFCWALQHMLRAGKHIYSVWKGQGTITDKVEAGLIVMVIAGEFLDIKWDCGVLDIWLKKIVVASQQKEAAKQAKEAERLLEQGGVEEKKDLKLVETFVSAKEEKNILKAKEEVLVEVVEEKA